VASFTKGGIFIPMAMKVRNIRRIKISKNPPKSFQIQKVVKEN
jgi:hypothetical protein